MLIVIKVGTNVLTDNSYQIQDQKISQLVDQIAELMKSGHQVVLVSSGAVGSGREKIFDLKSAQSRQVWAAIGQPLLMNRYNFFAQKKGLTIAQCLVLRHDFSEKERYNNFISTLKGLLDANVLAIINENDVMATGDLTVGDNDLLSAMVAVAINADKLVLLTNQTGLYNSNPDLDPSAKLIDKVDNVDFELEKFCSDQASSGGRGGMLSKVRAAKHAVHAGIETYIIDGRERNALTQLIAGKKIGTRVLAKRLGSVSDQKRWLMSAKGFGQIIIDDGAVAALQKNKSLLFPGVIKVSGIFDKGEIVEVMGKKGNAVAYGKVNFASLKLNDLLVQKKQTASKFILDKEVIHRDFLVRLL